MNLPFVLTWVMMSQVFLSTNITLFSQVMFVLQLESVFFMEKGNLIPT